MSNATVLELKEKDAYQNYANGDYKVDLNQPLTVYQGDTIEIKNVFSRITARRYFFPPQIICQRRFSNEKVGNRKN